MWVCCRGAQRASQQIATGVVFLWAKDADGSSSALFTFSNERCLSLKSPSFPSSSTSQLLFARSCEIAKMAPIRRAPYKDFLQPSLHRRFSSTASILLAIAFVESVFLASWKSRMFVCFAPFTQALHAILSLQLAADIASNM